MLIVKYTILAVFAVLALGVATKPSTLAPYWHFGPQQQGLTLEEGIKQYFEEKTNVLHVRVHLKEAVFWKYVILHHLTDALRNSTKLTFRITIGDKYLRNNKDYLHNLWYVDSYEALNNILPYKKTDFNRRPGYYAIILEQFKESNAQWHIQKILEKMFSLNIIDVIIIRPNSEGKPFAVYSFEIFSKEHCRVVRPIIINRFVNGRFDNRELFPNKLRNFHNCTIRVLSRDVPPFFTYHKQDDNGTIIMKGFEAKLLNVIAEHLNFRIEPVINPDYYSGDVYPNGTTTGPYYLLDKNYVDVLMGYFFYTAQSIAFLEESLSYFTTALVVIVKHHPPPDNPLWMLDPFQLGTWLALLLMIATVILFMCILHLRYHYGNWLDIIGSIFGEPRAVLTRNYFARFGITYWYIGFIFINSAYQAKLFVTYNQPTPGLPHTINDLQRNNFTFLVHKEMNLKYWMPEINVPMNRLKFINTSEVSSVLEELLNSTGNVATLTTIPRMHYFERKRQLSAVFDLVPETVQLPEICAYFQHHSYLVKPFNNVISMMRSSGLISRWYDNALTDSNGQLEIQRSGNPKSLDLEKLAIVFFLLFCGQAVAFIVFIIEVIIARNKK
ncbi:ionotropic receptor 21a-like [Zeugodacus cucurbitae]|uniref:ionotropic receptor 21a-like n=1 Tax=Zeugodacus cucurbitae TaxID=28588 RepID=UPI0023D96761|nr:ionotropic receptor 21a-like [Zeugodacus cucurbitae]